MKIAPEKSSKISADCPICGSETSNVQSSELRRGTGIVLHCCDCDHGFLATNSILDLKTYYETEYRKEYSHNSEMSSTTPAELFEIYSKFQQNRLPHVLSELEKDSKLLEVGASAGQFLTHIKDQVETVHAIELDKDCCEFLTNNLNIENDSNYLEDSKFSDEEYDVICAFQVMEHVDDPVYFLKSLKKNAKPGGKIFVEVPNLRDPLLTVWDIPSHHKFFYHSAHLQYFTENSILTAAIKAGYSRSGVEVFFTQDYNLLNHMHWVMNEKPQENCLVGMNQIKFSGFDDTITNWLTDEFKRLNKRYIDRLVEKKLTSNMLLKLTND